MRVAVAAIVLLTLAACATDGLVEFHKGQLTVDYLLTNPEYVEQWKADRPNLKYPDDFKFGHLPADVQADIKLQAKIKAEEEAAKARKEGGSALLNTGLKFGSGDYVGGAISLVSLILWGLGIKKRMDGGV